MNWNILIVLILMERIGKSLRNPAKDTILSEVPVSLTLVPSFFSHMSSKICLSSIINILAVISSIRVMCQMFHAIVTSFVVSIVINASRLNPFHISS
ncbi:MAG TPA: hypothetical protein DCM73_11270 [Clostridiales bacterium]|nr:hypothetical protein [Clostridiales bacterium]